MIAESITFHSNNTSTATTCPWVRTYTGTCVIPGNWQDYDIPDVPRPTVYQRKLELSRHALRAIVRDARVGIDSGEARSLGAMRAATAPRDPRRRPSNRHHGWRESELRA
jgi:hypothetical protein